MKKPKISFVPNNLTEAQIAASYKKFIGQPRKVKKPQISDFFLSFSSNNHSDSVDPGFKTDRLTTNTNNYSNSNNFNDKNNKISLISRQSLNSAQRPKSERPNFRVSKEAAEYEEVPFVIRNKEYEMFKKLFEEKVEEPVTKNPKYEKKNKIQEIIENEYNFNKYGEESKTRRKSTSRSNSKSRTPRPSTHGTPKNDFNLKNKITFTFQTAKENTEKEEQTRPKRDRFFFDKIKEKYYLKIKKVFDEKTLHESQKWAQEEIERIMKEFKEYIDQTQEQKDSMQLEIKNSNMKLLEANRLSETLKVKLKLMEEKLSVFSKEKEEMGKKMLDLENFHDIYTKFSKKMKESFPDYTIDKFFQKFEYLENVCMDLTKRKLELEDDQMLMEKEKHRIANHYNDVISDLNKESKEKEKFIKSLEDAQTAKNLEFEESFSFKNQYMNLFKKIMQLYTKWSSTVNLYFTNESGKKKENDFPSRIVNTPEEVLEIMDKMVVMSTPYSAQSYIRKIMTSALRLIRKFAPEKVNEIYEPEKVYELTSQYLEQLTNELKKCRNDFNLLKQELSGKKNHLQSPLLWKSKKADKKNEGLNFSLENFQKRRQAIK